MLTERIGFCRSLTRRIAETPPTIPMKSYLFETRVRAPTKTDIVLYECVIAAVRSGWTPDGYEVRVYARNDLVYRSRVHLNRDAARHEAICCDATCSTHRAWSADGSGSDGRIRRLTTVLSRSLRLVVQEFWLDRP